MSETGSDNSHSEIIKFGKGDLEYMPLPEDRDNVVRLCLAGCTAEQIAEFLGIGVRTLRRHYADELKRTKLENIGKISEGMVARAIKGDNIASIFYLKCQAGWSEQPKKLEINHSGAVGHYVKHELPDQASANQWASSVSQRNELPTTKEAIEAEFTAIDSESPEPLVINQQANDTQLADNTDDTEQS